MSENRQIQRNRTTQRNVRVFDSLTTTDATPTVIASVPLGEGRASFFQAKLFAVTPTFSNAQAMNVQAGFRRPVGGNIVRATSANGGGLPYLASSGDFSGIAPTVDLVANTSTQRIEIVVKGKAGVTMTWHCASESLQNLI